LRLVHADDVVVLDETERGAVLCHDVRDPNNRQIVRYRKGRILSDVELADLRLLGPSGAHVLVPGSGDLLEDEAAARLAEAVAGRGLHLEGPHAGQVNLISAGRGFLRVNRPALERANYTSGLLTFTALGDRVVDQRDRVGGVKCGPLVIPGSSIEAIESLRAEEGPILSVEPFPRQRVAFVAADRLGETALARASTTLKSVLNWYGSNLTPIVVASSNAAALATAFRQSGRADVSVILVAGASATDPLDVVFDGLRRVGGCVEQIGIPVEPGTACWVGRFDGRPVLGLASCELFGKPGAIDLLLPRLLLGEMLDSRELAARLAYGGLITPLPRRPSLEADPDS
jgi:molybdenum cofactor cytidylyltransferase